MVGDEDDFIINDDGTPMQDNATGIDIEGNGLGHTDDDWASDVTSDDW